MAYRLHRRRHPLAGLGATIADLAAAIQRNEGFYPGSPAYRNNNPGNLTAGPGMMGTDPSTGLAIFPDYATGEAALQNQIQLNINRGLTLDQFFAGKPGVYAGYDTTDPNYAAKVAGWLNIPSDVPLSSIISQGGAPDLSSSSVDATTGLQTAGIDYSAFLSPDSSGTSPTLIAVGIAVGVAILAYAVG